MASPAPTVLTTFWTGAWPHSAPSASTRIAPSPPRLASTAWVPRARRSWAASMTSPRVWGTRPVSSASSCRFGLIRSGRAAQALGQRRPGAVHGDGHPVAAAQVDQLAIPPGGDSGGQAAPAHQPGRARQLLGHRGDEAVTFVGAEHRAGLVDLGDRAVGLGQADVAADLPGDRHDDGVEAGGVEHLAQLGPDGAACGDHGLHCHTVARAGPARR